MTLAQRTLLAAAEQLLATIDTTDDMVLFRRALRRLRKATDAAIAEDVASLPSVDVPALLRRQAE